jgi:hypothetical protein
MDVRERCNRIEECYEFMLGYAAKGHPSGELGDDLRQHLKAAVEALNGIAEAYGSAVHHDERYMGFLGLLERDAANSRIAMELVLSLESISSQVIDNLNALIHLRALLTDLFLIDEILRSRKVAIS